MISYKFIHLFASLFPIYLFLVGIVVAMILGPVFIIRGISRLGKGVRTKNFSVAPVITIVTGIGIIIIVVAIIGFFVLYSQTGGPH